LLPESVVWLCANSRVAEAERIIRNAAKINNVTMPDKILARPDAAEGDGPDDCDENKRMATLDQFRGAKKSRREILKMEKDADARYTIVDLFRNRRLAVNLFCMALNWSVLRAYYDHVLYSERGLFEYAVINTSLANISCIITVNSGH